MNRRDFLKLAVGSASGIALAGSPFALLFSKDKKEQEQGWKELTENWKFTTCNLCPAGCGAACRVINGNVVRVQGNPVHPVNKGALCPKGLASLQFLYSPARLKSPMKKEGAGFTPVSWKEALNMASNSISAVKNAPSSLLFAREEGFSLTDKLVEYFMSAIGSPNLLTCGLSPYLETAISLTQGYEGIPAYDFKNSNYILSFGTSLFESFRSPVYAMQCYGYLRQERPGKKAKLVQVEPRFSATAGRSDEFIAVKPGTEGLFALGIAYVLIKEELYDTAFVDKFCFGFEDFRDEENRLTPGFKNVVLKQYPVDYVSQVTGAPVDTILRVAREFAANRPAMAVADTGANDYSNATLTAVAAHCLNALVGSVDSPGGILFQEDVPYNFPVAHFVKRADAMPPSAAADNILSGSPHEIQVALFQNFNPVFSTASGAKWKEAIQKIPFKISFSSFLDETSSLCNLVIPDLTFFEKWDAVSSPAVGFPVSGLIQPVVKPASGSGSTADFIIQLTNRIYGRTHTTLPFSDSKEMVHVAMQGIYSSSRGTTFGPEFEVDLVRHSEERGFWYPAQRSYQKFFTDIKKSGGWFDPRYVYESWGNVFQTPSGKFEFCLRGLKENGKDSSRIKLPYFEAPRFKGNTKDYPYLLLVYKTIALTSSDTANIPYLQEIHGNLLKSQWDSFVEINPETAERLRIHNGDKVILETKNKSILVTAKVFQGIPENTVAMALGQGHDALKPVASGIGANPLTLISPETDVLSGESALVTTRVRMRKA